jgi:DNA-binding transcriptional MerR regulator
MTATLGDLLTPLAAWRGTAAELANQCNSLISMLSSLAPDAGAANERLVRHYVQVGVLTPPDREGREALFGVRQVVEFLATRYLLGDGWPLAKAGEMVRTTDLPGLLELIPAQRVPTRAEQTVARYREQLEPAMRRAAPPPRVENRARQLSLGSVAEAAPSKSFPASAQPGTASKSSEAAVREPRLTPVHAAAHTPVTRAAEISRRRVALADNLQSLGNRSGRPESRRLLRISLTPWCHVHIDARHLKGMTDDTPGILGAALTQALHDERTRKVEKT